LSKRPVEYILEVHRRSGSAEAQSIRDQLLQVRTPMDTKCEYYTQYNKKASQKKKILSKELRGIYNDYRKAVVMEVEGIAREIFKRVHVGGQAFTRSPPPVPQDSHMNRCTCATASAMLR
jgi:hypothetical protein